VYSCQLWKALARCSPEITLIALVDRGPLPGGFLDVIRSASRWEILPVGIAGWGAFLARLDKSRHSWLIHAFESTLQLGVPRKAPFHVLHMLTQSPALFRDCPVVTTVHDLGPLGAGSPGPLSRRQALERMYWKRVERSDRLICDSGSTLRDAHRYLKGCETKTRIVHPGIDTSTFKPFTDRRVVARKRFHLREPYFLHVGVCAGRKNPEGLLRATKIASQDHPRGFLLALVGPYQVNPRAKREIENLAEELGIADRVVNLGDVTDAELAGLYNGALGLVYPSLYEGFGLPAVEALACGTPCVVSNLSSLPEVVGDLGILVDPQSPRDIAEGMLEVLRGEGDRGVLENGPRWARRFSWDSAASECMEIYRELVDDPRGRSTIQRGVSPRSGNE
jgi:glycosyltransferase involved in cell wall biosynthesis